MRKRKPQAPAVPPVTVGIGASAGGFEAFRAMLYALPPDTGMAFVFVLHLDPGHKSMLANLLGRRAPLPVDEVTDGTVVEPNHVYVIPPNTEMGIVEGVLRLTGRRKNAGKYMPIDHFLSSLAEDQRSQAIGVILSGTASDGTLGLKAIKAEGGITFAQDERSAKYDGMPRSAIAAGCVDFVLPPDQIAKELARISRQPRPRLPELEETAPSLGPEESIQEIFRLLRSASGVDFTHYKAATMKRRIARRMVLNKLEQIDDYVKRLRSDRTEMEALYQDIFIHVTSFFREPGVFRRLQSKVFPKILAAKPPGESLRVWAPGCSTGEEVYSLAIVLLEFLGERATSTPVQIFGTDISEAAIEKARAGIYAESSVAGVESGRLRRFFAKVEGGWQVIKSVRDLCIFARQDLVQDPPFSRIDLISCRNVLIYLGPILQRRIMAAFHYALRDSGFLVLGKSETLSAYGDLFALEDTKCKFYSRKATSTKPILELVAAGFDRAAVSVAVEETAPAYDVQREADRLVWSRYAHAGLIIDDDSEIVHFRGQTSPYLAPVPGKASLNLLKMVREELSWELRAAIHKVKKESVPVRREGIRLKQDGRVREINLEVLPLAGPDAAQRHLLILFEQVDLPGQAEPPQPPPKAKRTRSENREFAKLKHELESTREYLQTIIEEQETTNEELKSANEEVLSSNEELQSTNEELETAKEELQSGNEELVTLNEQLQNRYAELSQLIDDLANVLAGLRIPILMLGSDLCIRRFTPAAEKLLNLLPTDVGRPIGNIRPNLDLPDLGKRISEVIDSGAEREEEVRDSSGHWFSLRIRPFRTADGKIDGVLMVFVDIDRLKRSLDEVTHARDFVAGIVESTRQPLVVLDRELRAVTANPAFYSTFQVSPGETEKRRVYELGNRQWDVPELRWLLERVLPANCPFDDFEVEHEFPAIGRRQMLVNARPIQGSNGGLILLSIEDITERERVIRTLAEREEALRESEEKLRALTAGLFNAQEQERRRISRELHDDLNQKLAMLAVEVETLEKRFSSSDEVLHGEFKSLRERAAGLSDDIRRTAYRLHPSMLEHLGLPSALKALCTDFDRQEGLKVLYRQRDVPDSIPPEVSLCLYRVAQESLRNVAKHSGARRATVVLAGIGDGIRLSVSDTGVGFDPATVKGKGLGIVSMEERVRLLVGALSIKSRPSDGTRVIVHIPLEGGGP